jgi:hypothetical protein
MDREVLKYLITLVNEEIVFLDRGYGRDKPESVLEEYRKCQDARDWLQAKVMVLNQREGLLEYQNGDSVG